MSDIDCDDFGIESAMRRATRIRWVNSRTVPYVPVDADDCAPGLETPGNASLHWVLTRPEVQAALRLCALVDHDHDRPSSDDDITRAAFDAMDGEP